MGKKSIYNSIHKPQRSPNETLGFNQDGHPYRMCNETGIPMVVMVTSRARSLRNPTQQDFINALSHTFQILKNPPEYTMQYSVQPGRNTKNEAHAHLLGNA